MAARRKKGKMVKRCLHAIKLKSAWASERKIYIDLKKNMDVQYNYMDW